jgi:hypothetical protein
LGDFAFARSSLKVMDLPNNLLEIGEGCFQNCRDLHTVHSGQECRKFRLLPFSGVCLSPTCR